MMFVIRTPLTLFPRLGFTQNPFIQISYGIFFYILWNGYLHNLHVKSYKQPYLLLSVVNFPLNRGKTTLFQWNNLSGSNIHLLLGCEPKAKCPKGSGEEVCATTTLSLFRAWSSAPANWLALLYQFSTWFYWNHDLFLKIPCKSLKTPRLTFWAW